MASLFRSLLMLAPLGVAAAATEPWFAQPEVIHGQNDAQTVRGVVFEDLDRDGRRGKAEPGLPGVLVSNGLDVVSTGPDGSYELPVHPDMNLFVVQPSGWRVPTDRRMVPQFFHVHKAGGSPTPLRFGGLPDTGPAPAQVNFPLIRSEGRATFSAAVFGDTQTYSNTEVGYFRDSTLLDLLDREGAPPAFMLYVGDVVGDDLGLLDRLLEVGATIGAPQWLVHGNHDLDFDATSDADSSDSWRRLFGPQYYAFEQGQALFVVLDNVVYPCGPDDTAMPGREFCVEGAPPTYNGRVTAQQMTWLANLLDHTPPDRLIVLAHHIPFVSFVDHDSTKHQTDNLREIHELIGNRPALSLSGHTHTIENLAPGESFAGWSEAGEVEQLPFRHIVAGAGSGGWYSGDFNFRGVPMRLQRMGAPPGVLTLDFDGTTYKEGYLSGYGAERTQWLGLNTPAFRAWFEELVAWAAEGPANDAIPPKSINDLPDTRLLTPADLTAGVYLTANVWAGSAETRVTATLNHARPLELTRTQEGHGEAPKIGAEWADPFAAQRQLSVARVAYVSESGEPRAQGFELFKGSRFGPSAPRPLRWLADRNLHLWRVRLPDDLSPGVYRVEVTSTDRHGRQATDPLIFEVREQRPPPHWRHEPWAP
ncbi:MAG: calcineurin-like phosphoesterase C-terminal domain-containing protein [Opitutales bacterium]